MKIVNHGKRKFIKLIVSVISMSPFISSAGMYLTRNQENNSDGLINLKDFLTDDDWLDCNSKNPIRDHSYALVKALSSGNKIYIPPVDGYYLFKDVEIPDGSILIGNAELPYTVKQKHDITSLGSAISIYQDGNSIFKINNHVTMSGLVFFGNKKIDGLPSATGKKVSNVRLDKCGFYNFRTGIGSLTNYIKVDVKDCISSSNTVGIANIVDSKVVTSTINANVKHGIMLNSGANDNILSDLKIEWNGINNFYVSNAVNNILSTSILDRSGKAGLYIENSELVLQSLVIRRSGGTANLSSESTHFYINESNVMINGVLTKSGRNDDGSGNMSPDYTIYIENESATDSVIVSDSDLTGRLVNTFGGQSSNKINTRNAKI